MPIAHEFEYVKPATLEDAVAILAERGTGACVLAGGTDVVAQLRDDAIAPEIVVDIKGIPGLAEIRTVGERLFVGPLVTFTDLIESGLIRESFPLLYEMAVNVASKGVRNRATIAGNICSAVPSCDAGPVLLVYDALVVVLGPEGERSVPVDEWFTGPKKTDLRARRARRRDRAVVRRTGLRRELRQAQALPRRGPRSGERRGPRQPRPRVPRGVRGRRADARPREEARGRHQEERACRTRCWNSRGRPSRARPRR